VCLALLKAKILFSRKNRKIQYFSFLKQKKSIQIFDIKIIKASEALAKLPYILFILKPKYRS
jgi:hypothetical protein